MEGCDAAGFAARGVTFLASGAVAPSVVVLEARTRFSAGATGLASSTGRTVVSGFANSMKPRKMPGVSMANGLTMTCGCAIALDREVIPKNPFSARTRQQLAQQWNVDEDVVETLQRNVGAAEVDGLGVIVGLTAQREPDERSAQMRMSPSRIGRVRPRTARA